MGNLKEFWESMFKQQLPETVTILTKEGPKTAREQPPAYFAGWTDSALKAHFREYGWVALPGIFPDDARTKLIGAYAPHAADGNDSVAIMPGDSYDLANAVHEINQKVLNPVAEMLMGKPMDEGGLSYVHRRVTKAAEHWKAQRGRDALTIMAILSPFPELTPHPFVAQYSQHIQGRTGPELASAVEKARLEYILITPLRERDLVVVNNTTVHGRTFPGQAKAPSYILRSEFGVLPG
jgi:hypothetical protein